MDWIMKALLIAAVVLIAAVSFLLFALSYRVLTSDEGVSGCVEVEAKE